LELLIALAPQMMEDLTPVRQAVVEYLNLLKEQKLLVPETLSASLPLDLTSDSLVVVHLPSVIHRRSTT
jgi:hypothetical protein